MFSGNVLDLERYFRTELHNNRFIVCYFGDSLKSDIISCDKTCGWKTVYLAEELLVDGDTSQLEDGDSDLLNTKGFDMNSTGIVFLSVSQCYIMNLLNWK